MGIILMYFLDTNTCLYALNKLYPALDKKLAAVGAGDIQIPAMVEAEMLVGFEKGARRITRAMWEHFARDYAIIPFDSAAARCMGISGQFWKNRAW
jgi:tRNA(fMet)-specific endonuclease VapC